MAKKTYSNKLDPSDEQRERVQRRLGSMSAYHSATYEYIEEQLRFNSGEQWDEEVQAQRTRAGMPSLVIPLTNSYIKRVCNPLLMHPVGMNVETDDEGLTELISGVVREIEEESRSREAYEQAHQDQVTAGLGWIRIGTDYEDDDSLNQKITVNIVRNPLNIYIDPLSEQSDGSDAQFGVFMSYLDEDVVKEEYGDDYGVETSGIDMYSQWERSIPDNTVPEVIYYEIANTKVDKFFYEDGSTSEEEEIQGMKSIASRKISRKECKICRYIGQKLVDETTLPIPFIPLVPVYGDRLVSRNDNVKLAGLVHYMQSSQRMTNAYASSEAQVLSNAPKSPFIGTPEQFEGHDEWSTANTENHEFMTYNHVSYEDGSVAPMPTRMDNAAQTQGYIQSRVQAQQDIGRTVGIFDAQLGSAPQHQESGIAAINRSENGEIATAHYTQNLHHSISQVARIVLYMIPYVYDTPRQVTVRSEDGERYTEEINLKAILTPALLKSVDIDFTAGPMIETKRREANNGILSIASMMPDQLPILADILVSNMNAPGSKEVAKRLKKMLPEQLQEETEQQVDPQAQQMLQQADQDIANLTQQNAQLEAIVKQLQAKSIADAAKNKTSIATTVIKAEADLAKERIRQAGEDDRLAEKIEADASQDMMNIAKDAIASGADISTINVAPGSDSYVPPVPGPLMMPSEENEIFGTTDFK
tara:strand:+ start:142 stop:2244 length:2103 start_codon:yes stop_codon:yes gene_type:complete